MPEYKIVWETYIEAEDGTEACREALKIQRDPDNEDLCFRVRRMDTGQCFVVDLLEEDWEDDEEED